MSNASTLKLSALRSAVLVGAATSEVTLQQVQEAVEQRTIVGPFTIPFTEPLPIKAIKRLAGENGEREATVKEAHSLVFSGVEGIKRGKLGAPQMETQTFAQFVDANGEVFAQFSISGGYRDGNRQTDEADNIAIAVVHASTNEWTVPSRQAASDKPKVDAVQAATNLLNQNGASPLGIYIDETRDGNPGLSRVIEDGLLATHEVVVDGVVAYEALRGTMRTLPKPASQAASKPGATIADNSKAAPKAGTGVEVVD